MSPATRSTFDEELARARLAFISAGQPSLGAPRRAIADAGEDPPVDGEGKADSVVSRAPDDPSKIRIFDRFLLTTRQVVAVLVLLLCGVVVAVLALGRSSASQVPVDVVPAQSASASLTQSPPSASPPVMVRVHVLGAVVSPGVVTVTQAAIVQDAVVAAGGLRPDADPAELNLAAPVSDGQQVVVGTAEEPRGEVNEQPGTAATGQLTGQVNINTATETELEQLPGVGPVLAGQIVLWRQENDGFSSVTELQEVSGIGPKSFAKLEPLVTV